MRQNYQISEQFPSYQEAEAMNFPVFLLQEYVELFNEDQSICPLLIRGFDNKVLAYWVFQEKNDCWISPIAAPFSCPQFYDDISFNVLLKLSISYLKNKSNKPIRFVINPLFTNQYKYQFDKILKIEINQFLKIDEDSFMRKLPQKRRRQKLRVLKSEDYTVSSVSCEQWESVYQKNLKWRIQKGHQNYIPLKLMIQFKNRFPNNYYGFQLTFAKKLIGCAFIVRVSNDYFYLYSLITDPEYDAHEPSLLLYEMIYDTAKSNHIKVLDLGTSMNLDGHIHQNIFNYKKDIGASAVRKYTFEC